MKTIFLINPISGRGHLDAYARLYARAFVELGHRVVLVADTDGDATDYLARNAPSAARFFTFVSFDQAASLAGVDPARPMEAPPQVSPNPGGTAQAELARQKVTSGILPQSLSRRTLRRQLGRIKRALGRRLLKTRLAAALNVPFYFDVNRIKFHPMIECVDRIVSRTGQAAPDLIFFLYLDLMAERPHSVAVLDRPQGSPWSGILFHPRLVREDGDLLEGYFKSRNARGGVFLVPSAIPAYAKATPHLHFALAPDVADLELPDETFEVARNMRERAGNRMIVLQIGSITAHKGIPTLLDVIAAADPSRFFFALIGEVHWESFGGHKSRIRSFYARPPENVFLSQGYIKSERDYNDIVRASDIIYAVYQGFGSSSNSLTKAAGLRRPILVSENSLMGDRVRNCNIGSTAPEGDAAAILERLDWLVRQPRENFDFSGFADEHSLEALKRKLGDALPSWLAA